MAAYGQIWMLKCRTEYLDVNIAIRTGSHDNYAEGDGPSTGCTTKPEKGPAIMIIEMLLDCNIHW